jgi:hypothetical protein
VKIPAVAARVAAVVVVAADIVVASNRAENSTLEKTSIQVADTLSTWIFLFPILERVFNEHSLDFASDTPTVHGLCWDFLIHSNTLTTHVLGVRMVGSRR